jgi:outer membrane protein OmpA-like peptidoglycan-associated protein
MNRSSRCIVVLAAAVVLVASSATVASAEPTPTVPPLVVPLPNAAVAAWVVQDILAPIEEVKGTVEDARFVTSSVDGSSTEIGGSEFILKADVMFGYNKANLTIKAKAMLTDVAAKLKASQATTVVVTGHTDADGDGAYNMVLSRKRAKAVRAYLSSALPAGTKILAVGKGETQPRASNATKKGRALNRRVDIKIPQ